jgi:endoglucanase
MDSMKNLTVVFFLLSLCLLSCNADLATSNNLTVSADSLEFVVEGGVDTFFITTDAGYWNVDTPVDWVRIQPDSGNASQGQVIVTVSPNPDRVFRSASLTITGEHAKPVMVLIKQLTRSSNGTDFPDYSNPIPEDHSQMADNALDLARKMQAGWNLGNSLEVPGNETGWGNPKATQLLIDSIHAAGFNTIRLPCAWNSYIQDQTTWKIRPSWLSRVQEVVDYCYKNGMYVILNIHWDNGWLENNPTYAKQSLVNSKQRALWEQIAVHFRDYDEHLLFAGTNEVHANYNTPTTENNTVQQSYNQTFVSAVRSTGGRNHFRNLVVQSYNTNIGFAKTYLKLPQDVLTNRLFVEVHYYDPWDFCGDEGSTGKSYWGSPYAAFGISTWGQEDWVQSQFGSMKTAFVNKGYPVILGEYGAIRRSALTGTALTNHLAARAYYLNYVTKAAKANGMVPCYWDNGGSGNNGFGIFNRTTGAAFDRQALQALISGAASASYPF